VAVTKGDAKLVQKCLQKGADINYEGGIIVSSMVYINTHRINSEIINIKYNYMYMEQNITNIPCAINLTLLFALVSKPTVDS
jgi:microcompartment protein CcmL/EutN